MSVEKPYGSWKSPLSSKLACDSSVSLDITFVDSQNKELFYWSELHPHEDGRSIIYSKSPLYANSPVTRWINTNHNAKATVHEYGGGACIAHKENVFFTNGKDQQIYEQSSALVKPKKISNSEKCRYADGQYICCTEYFVCVREDHDDPNAKEPENTLVCINKNNGKEFVIASGHDFYASPRVTSNGKKIAWVQWNHPNMPWDETEVWVGELIYDKGFPELVDKVKISSYESSINYQEPKWTSDNKLMFINDQTGYWNLYIVDDIKSPEKARNIYPVDKEIGKPPWRLGYNSYCPHPNNKDVVAIICNGKPFIYNMATDDKQDIDVGNWSVRNCLYQPIDGEYILFDAVNPTKPSALLLYNCKEKKVEVFHSTSECMIDDAYLSQPTQIKFPVNSVDDENAFAYGYYYKPKNQDFHAPEGTLPPLLIKLHGGPTSCANVSLSLGKQYFTSRGFAILDVDYRGSTGYGTKYRELLRKKWGVYDVEDACAGALYLADVLKEVDRSKLLIDGGSAGGYTTLACLTFKNVFAAGASYYGVSDLELLAKETHKFESRYLDSMIGEYPKEQKLYFDRSPINFLEKFDVPCVFFQGGADMIVPENQAVTMFESLKKKKVKCAYVYFPDEGHGFRKSENNQKALNGEFYFYSVVLGFKPADENIEIPIEN